MTTRSVLSHMLPFLLGAALGWEAIGRVIESPRTPSALLTASVRVKPVGAASATVTERSIIAVLPLKNQSAGPDSEYFVDGLTDEIISSLAVIEGLQVCSCGLRSVAEQLGAHFIVEGSVRRVGNRLRVNAQLVQVASDVPLWVNRFDRELKDIFDIQDEISRAIVNTLRLTSGRRQRRNDADLEAYELYLKARALVGKQGLDNVQKAAGLFEQVIAKDSAFAPAHAELANVYATMSLRSDGIAFDRAYPIIRQGAIKALQLDPLLAEAHVAMGWANAYEHDWANAEKSFQRALELDPSLTHTYTSYSISTLRPLAKFDEALQLLHAASRNDPLALDLLRETGEVLLLARRYAEAVEVFERVRTANPEFPFIRTLLARALIFAGRASEALALETRGHWALAHAYTEAGQDAEAHALLLAHKGNPYAEAMIHAALGEIDNTLDALRRAAVSQPHRLGDLLIAPELVAYRGDPRFAEIRRSIGVP